MRDLKVHLAIDIKRTVPTYFELTTTWVLCDTPLAQRLTKDRSRVTCNICNHFAREYGDKYVIPRGNVFTPGRQLAQLRERLRDGLQNYVGKPYDDETYDRLVAAASQILEQYENVIVKFGPGKEFRVGSITGRFL